jgi:DNA-binding XRE family transcriptional regulator
MRPKHKRVLRLRQLRRARELTQAELAGRVGIHPNAYNAIEKGRSVPSLDTAKNIAAVFGEPVETVFGYVEVPA